LLCESLTNDENIYNNDKVFNIDWIDQEEKEARLPDLGERGHHLNEKYINSEGNNLICLKQLVELSQSGTFSKDDKSNIKT